MGVEMYRKKQMELKRMTEELDTTCMYCFEETDSPHEVLLDWLVSVDDDLDRYFDKGVICDNCLKALKKRCKMQDHSEDYVQEMEHNAAGGGRWHGMNEGDINE